MPDNKFEKERKLSFPIYRRRSTNDFKGGLFQPPPEQLATVNPLSGGGQLRPITPYTNPNQTSGQTQGATGRFAPMPKLYDENGKLNKQYDSSIYGDMLTGLAIGSRAGIGQDPFFQLGSSLAGLITGAFVKNVKGKQDYERDVAMVQQYNQQALAITNAEIRAQDSQRRVEKDARDEYWRQMGYNLKVKAQGMKDFDSQMKFFTQQAALATDPEASYQVHQAMKAILGERGIPAPWLDNPEFGMKWDAFKAGDYFMLRRVGGTEIREMADSDGNPISDMSAEKFIKLYDAINNDADSKKLTPLAMDAALKEARQIVIANVKGPIKAPQREAMVFNLGQMLVKSGMYDSGEDAQKKADRTNFLKQRIGGLLDTFGYERRNPSETDQTQQSQNVNSFTTEPNNPLMPTDPKTQTPVDLTKPWTNSDQLKAFGQQYSSTVSAISAKTPDEFLQKRTEYLKSIDPSYGKRLWESKSYIDEDMLSKMSGYRNVPFEAISVTKTTNDGKQTTAPAIALGTGDTIQYYEVLDASQKGNFKAMTLDDVKPSEVIGTVREWSVKGKTYYYLISDYNPETKEYRLMRVNPFTLGKQ